MATTQRSNAIDFCRFIGVICVILAHTNISPFIFNLRQFDVVMLVFVSALSFTYAKPINTWKDYSNYVIHRFRRLIIPVWLFLTLYFLLSKVTGRYFTIETVISSYLLINGIGYVWIFRVLFICSLINPLLLYLVKKLGAKKIVIILFIMIAANEGLNYLVSTLPGSIFKIGLTYVLLYTLGYGIISLFGINYRFSNYKQNNMWLVCMTVMFGVSYIVFNGALIQDFKFPPQLYYYSYGLIITFVLMCLFTKSNVKSMLITLFSKYSFYAYFSHIFIIEFNVFNVNSLNIIKPIMVVIYALALGCTYGLCKERIKLWIKKQS